MADAGARVADIGARWTAAVGAAEFHQMCATMQRLLDAIGPGEARG